MFRKSDFFILLAVWVGLDYILQGFFNIKMLGS